VTSVNQHAPVKVLIAALGGEGGGVLSSWMHKAAIASGHFVQGTFIPGVAQRTGATTYYLEVVPGAGHHHGRGGGRPVLALNAVPGEVDLVVASEFMEAGRAIQAGFVTPERTVLIASSARVFTVEEKTAMGDGRFDAGRLRQLAHRFARQAVVADLASTASAVQAPLSAVLLGAIAASGVLPVSADAFRAAIRSEGKAVEANLRGFEAGIKAGGAGAADVGAVPHAHRANGHDAGALSIFPFEAHAVLAEAAKRLADYQNAAYAQRYLGHVKSFVGRDGADAVFITELARHLAVRMSVEDVMRVAQLKLRASRLARVTSEARAAPGDIVDITEYMKPGPEEIFGLLPPRLGRWALRRASHWGSFPMKVRTTRLSGHLRLSLLAALRHWRPRTLRFADERAWLQRWLELVERTLAVAPAAAREVVATASLVRGYSETYKRGLANWTRIMDEVVEPMLDGRLPSAHFADAVLQARLAANKDPEGETLDQTIAAIQAMAVPDRQHRRDAVADSNAAKR
jgi:indolepyruvate ferredoxin oxidoreductase beta subunit